jgi:hypothetical protein
MLLTWIHFLNEEGEKPSPRVLIRGSGCRPGAVMIEEYKPPSEKGNTVFTNLPTGCHDPGN